MIFFRFEIMGAKLRRIVDSVVHYTENNVYLAEYFVYYTEKVCTNRIKCDGIREKCVPLQANFKTSAQ